MQCATTSTYPENLGSGVSTTRGARRPSLSFFCLFLFFFVRHATLLGTESPDGAYTYWELGGNGHKAPGQF